MPRAGYFGRPSCASLFISSDLKTAKVTSRARHTPASQLGSRRLTYTQYELGVAPRAGYSQPPLHPRPACERVDPGAGWRLHPLWSGAGDALCRRRKCSFGPSIRPQLPPTGGARAIFCCRQSDRQCRVLQSRCGERRRWGRARLMSAGQQRWSGSVAPATTERQLVLSDLRWPLSDSDNPADPCGPRFSPYLTPI